VSNAKESAARCVFCAIVAGKGEASVVHDDEAILAFMDIRPVTPGRLLVIPKAHVPYLAGLDEALGARMMTVAMRASGLRCDGINLFLADGEAAGQEVFHTHLHVFPRFAGHEIRIDADWAPVPSRAELDEQAKRIRQARPA
jgi:histidine triad (HIT) family protein